jgi:hypothetical protein
MKTLKILVFFIGISVLGFSQKPTDTIRHLDARNQYYLDSLIVVVINSERVKVNKKPLAFSRELSDFGGNHTRWMAENNKFEHSKEGIGSGECLLYGGFAYDNTFITCATAIVNSWMDSPPHRAILLDGSYKIAGAFVNPFKINRLPENAHWPVTLMTHYHCYSIVVFSRHTLESLDAALHPKPKTDSTDSDL